jgi:HlyD family secretion protein
MKKLLTFAIVAGVLGFGYWRLSNFTLDFAFTRGETTVVKRGDLEIPINAMGPIEPLARHEIKSEASGEVIEILHQPGDMVQAGSLLIRLAKDNEQRSVDRAKSDVERTKATLDSAIIKKRRLQTVGLSQAQFRIDQTQAQLDFAMFNYDKIKRLHNDDHSSPDELERVGSSYRELVARLNLAKADLEDANITVSLAEQDVILTRAAYEQAQTTLADADERLSDTQVNCPVDGMVVAVNTQVGEVIQGGKTTLTGGTVLAVVANVSKLYVRAEVDEADIGAVIDLAPDIAKPGVTTAMRQAPIQTGTKVKIRVESYREEQFEGVIERIYPEPNSRISSVVTYPVDILITSDNRHKLLVGMQADVEFTAQSVTNAVLVPHEAIKQNDFGDLGVYRRKVQQTPEDPDREFVKCLFGLDNGMYAEVIEGLNDGDVVYTKLPQKPRGDNANG